MDHTQEMHKLYSTKRWQKCAKEYAASVGYLCERCLSKGIIRPYRAVHHKIHINSTNIKDESIVFNWENLEALCMDCHAAEHRKQQRGDYFLDELGNVCSPGSER